MLHPHDPADVECLLKSIDLPSKVQQKTLYHSSNCKPSLQEWRSIPLSSGAKQAFSQLVVPFEEEGSDDGWKSSFSLPTKSTKTPKHIVTQRSSHSGGKKDTHIKGCPSDLAAFHTHVKRHGWRHIKQTGSNCLGIRVHSNELCSTNLIFPATSITVFRVLFVFFLFLRAVIKKQNVCRQLQQQAGHIRLGRTNCLDNTVLNIVLPRGG